MTQTIAIDENQIEFVKHYSQYGFKSEDELINEALDRLRSEFEHDSLLESAELYADIYETDEELRMLTETALTESLND